MSREPIYAALFAKLFALKTAGTVKECSRLLKHWNDCPNELMPAIYMAQAGEVGAHQLLGSPYKWDINVKVYVYIMVADGDYPGPILNPVLDAIELSLAPIAGAPQTLGGLVTSCYIDGAIETYEGTLGNKEVAIIPIKILVR